MFSQAHFFVEIEVKFLPKSYYDKVFAGFQEAFGAHFFQTGTTVGSMHSQWSY